MSLPLHSQLPLDPGSIRDAASRLVDRAGMHENDLQALVATADMHIRHAEEALSDAVDATHGRGEYLRAVLRTQLQQSQDDAATARKLCAGAHVQHEAAGLLLAHLDGDRFAQHRTEPHRRIDAVLVVDDSEDLRDMVTAVLRNAGFTVRTAANGLEGLLAAYDIRPEVIVMDVSMPVLDGIEATRLLKAAEATRQARVIAYTGNSPLDDSVVENLFAAVLQKPATPAALLAMVQHVASL